MDVLKIWTKMWPGGVPPEEYHLALRLSRLDDEDGTVAEPLATHRPKAAVIRSEPPTSAKERAAEIRKLMSDGKTRTVAAISSALGWKPDRVYQSKALASRIYERKGYKYKLRNPSGKSIPKVVYSERSEDAIYEALGTGPATFKELVDTIKRPSGTISSAIAKLKKAGKIKSVNGAKNEHGLYPPVTYQIIK